MHGVKTITQLKGNGKRKGRRGKSVILFFSTSETAMQPPGTVRILVARSGFKFFPSGSERRCRQERGIGGGMSREEEEEGLGEKGGCSGTGRGKGGDGTLKE